MPVAIPIALVVAAGVSAVVSKYNADQQSAAAGNALGAQEKAAGTAQQQLTDARNQGQTAMQPYINQGQSAMNQLASRQNFTFSESDPSYQFRQQAGQDAVSASAAARGGYFSGATGTALQKQGQNLASEEYQNEYNRWAQQNNFLQSQVNSGEQASSYAAGLGYNTGNSQAGISTGLGNSQALTINNQATTQAGATSTMANSGVNLIDQLAKYYGNTQTNNVSNNLVDNSARSDMSSTGY